MSHDYDYVEILNRDYENRLSVAREIDPQSADILKGWVDGLVLTLRMDGVRDERKATAAAFYYVERKRARYQGHEEIAPLVSLLELHRQLEDAKDLHPKIVYVNRPCAACAAKKKRDRWYQSKKSGETVYVVSDGRGRIKVGTTKHLDRRMKTLRTAIPDLQLLLSTHGNESLEKLLHEQLKQFRIAGEWFVDRYETRSVIAELLGVPIKTEVAA